MNGSLRLTGGTGTATGSKYLLEIRAVLDALAGLLLKREVVERATLDELLNTAGGTPRSHAPKPLPVAAAIERSGPLADAQHG